VEEKPYLSRKVNPMLYNKHVLLAVDESEASDRAVEYTAEMLGGAAGFHVGLLHLELPPHMLEWGGAEEVAVEDRVSAERRADYGEMETKAVAEGRTMLQRYRTRLAEHRIEAEVLLVQFEEPLSRKTIAEHILKTAKERGYGTIVVGRHLFSFWERIFQRHVGETLVHTGEDVTIWVIGTGARP
jgi:nucleotide-binding universal stress UspA family protein